MIPSKATVIIDNIPGTKTIITDDHTGTLFYGGWITDNTSYSFKIQWELYLDEITDEYWIHFYKKDRHISIPLVNLKEQQLIDHINNLKYDIEIM